MKKFFLFIVLLVATSLSAFSQGSNTKSTTIDSDGDGIFDTCDADSDNDGIPDVWEDQNRNGLYNDEDIDGDLLYVSTLGDGIANYLDLDSENDGILDLFESGIPLDIINIIDKDRNGVVDSDITVGANGFADILETFPDSGIPKYELMDTDGDGQPDYSDLKSDGSNYDLYAIGKDYLDDLGGGFISRANDSDADGIQAGADTDQINRGAPGSPVSPYTPATGGTAYTGSDNANNAVSSTCAANLPVHFGSISAIIKNNQLHVSWQTLTEMNNSHFEIELSEDGKSFTNVGKVLSIAREGNSQVPINYEFNIDAGNAAALLGSIGLLSMLGAGFKRMRKTVRAAALILVLGFMACNKTGNEVVAGNRPLYLRIKQVDKDGGFEYSKVIKINDN